MTFVEDYESAIFYLLELEIVSIWMMKRMRFEEYKVFCVVNYIYCILLQRLKSAYGVEDLN